MSSAMTNWFKVKPLTFFIALSIALLFENDVQADQLELLSGAKVNGTILSKSAAGVEMQVQVGKITFKRTYAINTIHAVTHGATRQVINEKGAAVAASAPAAVGPGKSTAPSNVSASAKTGNGRGNAIGSSAAANGKGGGGSRAELDALIESVGKTPPEWFAETKLNYPATLDLTWPEPAPGGWNAQKNMGQFIWDVVNPNPGRWREGIRLMHHLLEQGKGDERLTGRVVMTLGNMYHNLIEDYARSAFWFRAAGVERSPEKFLNQSVTLAECYWRLGYRNEALALLNKAGGSFPKAKLLADMGETEKAIKLAAAGGKDYPDTAYLVCGDACRVAGRYKEALQYYQRVADVPEPPKPNGRLTRNRQRATANIEAIKFFDTFDLSKVADGTFTASSQGYEGQVEVSVNVQGNKIVAVDVTNHKEKQFYSAITDTPKKIIAKQNVKGVDATSHATITSEAIINATAKAVAQSK